MFTTRELKLKIQSQKAKAQRIKLLRIYMELVWEGKLLKAFTIFALIHHTLITRELAGTFYTC